MYLSSSSAAGIRFLASIKNGHGLKPSARHAGIDKEVGYRWLREEYLRLRRDGKTPTGTTAELGFTTSRLVAWEADVGQVKTAIIFGQTSTRRPAFGRRLIMGKALGMQLKRRK
jgi:IS30 family transposase